MTCNSWVKRKTQATQNLIVALGQDEQCSQSSSSQSKLSHTAFDKPNSHSSSSQSMHSMHAASEQQAMIPLEPQTEHADSDYVRPALLVAQAAVKACSKCFGTRSMGARRSSPTPSWPQAAISSSPRESRTVQTLPAWMRTDLPTNKPRLTSPQRHQGR